MSRRTNQPDLFDTFRQDDLFDRPRVSERSMPEDARERMQEILRQARSASTLPWDDRTTAIYEVIFPQMSKWLPPEEAAELLSEFKAEVARLKNTNLAA
jgi:hypothetical protein